MPKTSNIALLVWRLAARGEPPSGRHLNQWQWPLILLGAWRRKMMCQAVCLSFAQQRFGSAKRIWLWLEVMFVMLGLTG